MKRMLIVLLFTAAVSSSQDVKVIHLSERHAENAKLAWAALKNAQARWEGTKEGIAAVYMKGDSRDWKFSDDFTVIVPSGLTGYATYVATSPSTPYGWPCTGIITSPANGTDR